MGDSQESAVATLTLKQILSELRELRMLTEVSAAKSGHLEAALAELSEAQTRQSVALNREISAALQGFALRLDAVEIDAASGREAQKRFVGAFPYRESGSPPRPQTQPGDSAVHGTIHAPSSRRHSWW